MGDETSGPDDAELMRRYCAGDRDAFHALYRRLAPRLFGYLRSLVGDRTAAEDLLQLTFLKLHRSRDVYVIGADPVPWLYTIAHRCALDERRRRKRDRVTVTKDGELPREPAVDLRGAPADRTPAPELGPAAMAGLDRLPANQREALLLTKVHGHSVATAAAIAGTTPGAIKLRAHRAYVTLRKLLPTMTETTEPAASTKEQP